MILPLLAATASDHATEGRTAVVLGVLALVGVVVAAWFGYLGQREGRKAGVIARQAGVIASRVEAQVTPNGGTTNTTGDATVRIESQLASMQGMVAYAVAELQQAVTRDDGRFARSERDMAALRDDVRGVTSTLGRMATDHEAIMGWIEQHTSWAEAKMDDVAARFENAAARLAALEAEELRRREGGS